MMMMMMIYNVEAFFCDTLHDMMHVTEVCYRNEPNNGKTTWT